MLLFFNFEGFSRTFETQMIRAHIDAYQAMDCCWELAMVVMYQIQMKERMPSIVEVSHGVVNVTDVRLHVQHRALLGDMSAVVIQVPFRFNISKDG